MKLTKAQKRELNILRNSKHQCLFIDNNNTTITHAPKKQPKTRTHLGR